jgi:hypothetical protein
LPVLIEEPHKVGTKLPTVFFMAHVVRAYPRLMAEAKSLPDLVKTVAYHTRWAKGWHQIEAGETF